MNIKGNPVREKESKNSKGVPCNVEGCRGCVDI